MIKRACLYGVLLVGWSATQVNAQVLESKPRTGPGGPPPAAVPATDSMGAATTFTPDKAIASGGFSRARKAPAGSAPPLTDPRDFSGIWVSRILSEQTVPTLKPELVGNIPAPQPSGFATPNLESRQCHPNAYLGGTTSYPLQIFQTDAQLNVLFEENRRIHRIHINGKQPKNPQPAYYGHSIGHWEGNTLVAETIALKGTIDYLLKDNPNVRVVEKMRKIEDGSVLDIEVTYYNDKEWATPGTMHVQYDWRPDLTLLEVVCEEFSDAFGRGYDTLR